MPGPRGPQGPKPKIKNPGKLFARLMGFIFKKYLTACIIVVICIFVSVLANVQGTMFSHRPACGLSCACLACSGWAVRCAPWSGRRDGGVACSASAWWGRRCGTSGRGRRCFPACPVGPPGWPHSPSRGCCCSTATGTSCCWSTTGMSISGMLRPIPT